jgi:predicted RNA-binding protein with RPS1 domain
VKVKVLEIDQRGKVRLSMRVVDQETGEELEDTRPAREPRSCKLRFADLMRNGSATATWPKTRNCCSTNCSTGLATTFR